MLLIHTGRACLDLLEMYLIYSVWSPVCGRLHFVPDPCRGRWLVFFVLGEVRSSCWRTPTLVRGNDYSHSLLFRFPFFSFFFFLFRREGLINDWRLFHVESHRAHYKNKSQWSLGPFALFIQQNRLSETNKFFGKKKKVLLMDNIHGHVEKSADNHENSHFRALIAKSIKIKRNPVRLARAS